MLVVGIEMCSHCSVIDHYSLPPISLRNFRTCRSSKQVERLNKGLDAMQCVGDDAGVLMS